METNVNYTIVGAFVIVLFTFAVLTIIWLSVGFSFEQYTTYQVYMKEPVSGLSIDAAVEYNGVNVGTVKSISINHKNPQIVELLLSLKSNTPVTKQTVAMLNVKGLTGIAIVSLRDEGLDTTRLQALPGQPYPVIKTVPSLFLQMDRALTKLNENIHQVSSSLQSLLDQENLRSIKQILINIREMTDTLSANRQQLNAVLQNTAAASRVLYLQTLPVANQTIMNIDSLSTELKQNPSMLIRGTTPQALGPGE